MMNVLLIIFCSAYTHFMRAKRFHQITLVCNMHAKHKGLIKQMKACVESAVSLNYHVSPYRYTEIGSLFFLLSPISQYLPSVTLTAFIVISP